MAPVSGRWSPSDGRATSPTAPGCAATRARSTVRSTPGRKRGDISATGGPGQNRTATAEGEGFTDPWAHHLPNRPTRLMLEAAAGNTPSAAERRLVCQFPVGLVDQQAPDLVDERLDPHGLGKEAVAAGG